MTILTPPHRRGFTIIEAVVSMAVVSLMLVAALNVAGAAGATRARASATGVATSLADALLEEILVLPYSDPSGAWVIGREAGETTADRRTLNDVDDYHGLVDSPPAERDGTEIPGLDAWERSVSVEWVRFNELDRTSGTPTGAKRITVTVKRGGVEVLRRLGLRCLL